MHFISLLAEVHSESRSKIQSEFRNTLPNWPGIAKVAFLNAINANPNPGSGWHIEPRQPFSERLSAIVVLTNQNLSGDRFHVFSLTESM
jgi:hypothetical protein